MAFGSNFRGRIKEEEKLNLFFTLEFPRLQSFKLDIQDLTSSTVMYLGFFFQIIFFFFNHFFHPEQIVGLMGYLCFFPNTHCNKLKNIKIRKVYPFTL